MIWPLALNMATVRTDYLRPGQDSGASFFRNMSDYSYYSQNINLPSFMTMGVVTLSFALIIAVALVVLGAMLLLDFKTELLTGKVYLIAVATMGGLMTLLSLVTVIMVAVFRVEIPIGLESSINMHSPGVGAILLLVFSLLTTAVAFALHYGFSYYEAKLSTPQSPQSTPSKPLCQPETLSNLDEEKDTDTNPKQVRESDLK